MRVGQARPLPGSASHSLYPIPQRVVQHFRFGVADALDLLQIGDAGSLDRRNGLEVCQQGGAGLFPHAGNGRQRGSVGALFHRALAVIIGVAVCFVLNIRHKGKDIAVAVDCDLAARIVHNGAGAVVVVLHHAEGRHVFERRAL